MAANTAGYISAEEFQSYLQLQGDRLKPASALTAFLTVQPEEQIEAATLLIDTMADYLIEYSACIPAYDLLVDAASLIIAQRISAKLLRLRDPFAVVDLTERRQEATWGQLEEAVDQAVRDKATRHGYALINGAHPLEIDAHALRLRLNFGARSTRSTRNAA